MDEANPAVPMANNVIARTQADGSLLGRDCLVYRPDQEPAPAERGYCGHPVTIEGEHGLVYGNGLPEPVLRAQHIALAKCASGLGGDDAKACSARLSARAMSAAEKSLMLSSTRPASSCASRLRASTDRGSSARAQTSLSLRRSFRGSAASRHL